MEKGSLESRLLYLPLWVVDKVELWLTYKGIKPGSLLALRREKGMTQSHVRRVKKWFVDAGLHYKADPHSKGKNLIVSKDKAVVEEIVGLKFGYQAPQENYYRLGLLLGYPPKAAKVYASGNKEMLIGPGDEDSPVKDTYESLYAQFTVRKGYEKEDIKTAKLWADTIRHDIPRLAQWFEKEASKPLTERKKLYILRKRQQKGPDNTSRPKTNDKT